MDDKKIGVIGVEINALEKKASSIRERLVVLENIIEPILTPGSNESIDNSVPGSIKESPISPITSQISSINGLLDNLLFKLNAIIDRVEV